MPAQAKAQNAKSNDELFMYVRSTTGDNRVAFHEVDDAHPGGSAFVAGPKVVKVGRTALAQERIRSRMLAEVKGDSRQKAQADKDAQAKIDALPDVTRPDVPDFDEVDEETGEVTGDGKNDGATPTA